MMSRAGNNFKLLRSQFIAIIFLKYMTYFNSGARKFTFGKHLFRVQRSSYGAAFANGTGL